MSIVVEQLDDHCKKCRDAINKQTNVVVTKRPGLEAPIRVLIEPECRKCLQEKIRETFKEGIDKSRDIDTNGRGGSLDLPGHDPSKPIG